MVTLAEVAGLKTSILDEVAAVLKVNRMRKPTKPDAKGYGYPEIRAAVKRAWPADRAHVTIGEKR